MTLPNVDVTVSDGALGLAPASVNRIVAKVGCCSAGTATTAIYPFTNPQDVPGILGYGPLAEAVAYHLQASGGVVYAVRTPSATSGAASAVTATQTGDGVVALTGTPLDKYSGKVLITAGGEAAAARFKYSLDGGETYSADITVPAGTPGTYVITNTGITLTFTAGASGASAPASYVVDDYFTFTTTAPEPDSTGVDGAISTLLNDSREWRGLHVVGNATPYANAVTGYAIATTCDTKMTAAEVKYRYTYAICEGRDIAQGNGGEVEADWITSMVNGLAVYTSTRVGIAGGFVQLESAIKQPGKAYMRRSCAWPIFAQRVKLRRSQDSGYIKATGKLPGVKSLYHNEDAVPGLDAGRFMTVRSITGVAGYYCTHAKMMATTTSDFQFLQYREVMDEACRISRGVLMDYLNADLRTNEDGTIDERDALLIDSDGRGALKAGLEGDISGIPGMTIKRTNNITSTMQMLATTRVRPKAYAKYIEVDVGYENPNLTLGQE